MPAEARRPPSLTQTDQTQLPHAPAVSPRPARPAFLLRAAVSSVCVPLGGESSKPVPASSRFAMEPSCPLLLAGFSLPLAKALTANTTSTADSNWTSTTSGKGPAACALSPRPASR